MSEPTPPPGDQVMPLFLMRPQPGQDRAAFAQQIWDALVAAQVVPPDDADAGD